MLVSRRSRTAVSWATDQQIEWVQCDPAQASSWPQGGALQQALATAEGVVNLAGEPIAEQRWTPAHLQLLHDSRIATTRHLTAAMADLTTPPSVLVNASAVGFYGTSEQASFAESSAAGTDVLGSLCRDWEVAAVGRPQTTRLVVAHESVGFCGPGAEIAATVATELFGVLSAPVQRVAGTYTPVPRAATLEAACRPGAAQLLEAIRRIT